eukprot:12478561-Alexandrium_andersonii.AAC.1
MGDHASSVDDQRHGNLRTACMHSIHIFHHFSARLSIGQALIFVMSTVRCRRIGTKGWAFRSVTSGSTRSIDP